MALVIVGAIFIFFLLVAVLLNSLDNRHTALGIGPKIAVIEVIGVITASEEINRNLKNFLDDDRVKAIVLRIDSPGGEVAPSQEIYEEVKKATELKPVVVSMGSVAASGGYYIAAPAQKIFANPGSITGSIGVIMEFANYEELLKKIGWHNDVIKSGQHKDIGSPNRPMTAADRQILQSLINDVHDQFVTAVAEGRKLDASTVNKLSDGRIFTGRQAQSVGLVDELGNLEDAIDAAAELAGIEKKPDIVYPEPSKPRLIDYLVEEMVSHFKKGLQEESRVRFNLVWSGLHQE